MTFKVREFKMKDGKRIGKEWHEINALNEEDAFMQFTMIDKKTGKLKI